MSGVIANVTTVTLVLYLLVMLYNIFTRVSYFSLLGFRTLLNPIKIETERQAGKPTHKDTHKHKTIREPQS